MSPTPSGDSSWLPVLALDPSKYVGLVDGADVYIGTRERPQREVDSETPIFLLPLLEQSLSDIRQELSDCDRLHGRPMGFFEDKFSLQRIPYAALRAKSDYWVSLALGWIICMNIVEYRDLLAMVSESDWASQKVRHRAWRMLKDLT
ncbi:hypothetical protein ABZ863_09195 [Saccharomonospora sp. NPDC046836]|uniref:hypothetical protein n=1 Tax=Saccharomonospora sp. NPDC046836 TaxID=3156921 RepID=UPI0033E674E0